MSRSEERYEPVDLLVAESDRGEAEKIRDWLGPILNRVQVFSDREKTADFLLRRGEFENESRRPDLLILDVDLLGDDCWRLIRSLRDRPEFEDVVVVALSKSREWATVERARRAGADIVMPRPVTIRNLAELADRLEDMGLAVVRKAKVRRGVVR